MGLLHGIGRWFVFGVIYNGLVKWFALHQMCIERDHNSTKSPNSVLSIIRVVLSYRKPICKKQRDCFKLFWICTKVQMDCYRWGLFANGAGITRRHYSTTNRVSIWTRQFVRTSNMINLYMCHARVYNKATHALHQAKTLNPHHPSSIRASR
jgi:hypothetical protein